jgi:broad specificity phosphatase PhoE
LETRVFLIRHGLTDWHRAGRVLGHRDIALNDEGLAQAAATTRALADTPIAEVISSPLVRALQTAEAIGRQFGIDVARDPRLIDLRVGKWEGMTYAEVAEHSEYKEFISDPLSERIPGAESLADVRVRAVAAIEQALEDNPSGDAIAVITHAGIIRVLLTHYLGSPPANYHRIRVAPGSISVLSFTDHRELPRVLAVNWQPVLTDVANTGG